MTPTSVLVDCLDKHGRILWRERVPLSGGRDAFTIGRSVAADVVLDDPYAAPMHLSLRIDEDGHLLLTDLGSINGISIDGHVHRDARDLRLPGNTFRVGATHLRLRSAGDSLAPEIPYRAGHRWLNNGNGIAAAAIFLAAALILYAGWLAASRDLAAHVATLTLGTAGLTAVWVGFWALLSRIMLGEWRWLRHTTIAVGVSGLAICATNISEIALFAASLPTLSPRWLNAIGVVVLLFAHLRSASHLERARSAAIALVLPIILLAGGYWMQNRTEMRDVNHIGAQVPIYPSYVRVRAAGDMEGYFRDLNSLRTSSDRKLADAVAAEGHPDE